MDTYGSFSLFRGLGPTTAREAVYTGGYLGISPVIAHHLVEKTPEGIDDDGHRHPIFGNNPFLARIAGARIGGSFAAIASHPDECAKTFVQSDMTTYKWPNTRVAVFRGEVEGGMGKMWNGLGPRIARLSGAAFVCIFQELAMEWKTNQMND
mmetsp:Transcript_30817/g.64945  ORF Transcript_30817/g.64945 Transcript_30817/m.64945 type:complete len:152 (-) Transcript_30817:140-595(-)|eukprot:CAMPEP_0171374194 /NCGR_PEP_ID=MMETSP0879-20121228/14261_1 /TAXON_ID=67004 /ORGANISM="Thalassiosira weissflogii, Strain CCMP1336" /LENGTH=151 /DNA_ID=CAMNT_0011883485 /DNA_START=651 /DNA_END=1106 /DNA_ORIENTATION=+